MGGQASKKQDDSMDVGDFSDDDTPKGAGGEPVKGAKSYALWHLADVRKARERARQYATDDNPGFAMVTRREFWELFSDYSKIVGSTFLALPMTLYDVYKQHRSDEKINAIEVLLMLGLFCHAKTDEQLEFCFALFDFDGGGSIDRVRNDAALRLRAWLTKHVPGGDDAVHDTAHTCGAQSWTHC